MTNKLIEIIHDDLIDKCWIHLYGGATYSGKQAFGDKKQMKTFPIACWVMNRDGELCETLAEHQYKIVPDTTMRSVIFWQQVGKARISPMPGISAVRRIKRGEITLELVAWLNMEKFSKPVDSKCYRSEQVVLEAIKTLSCRHKYPNLNFQDNGIGNIRLEVAEVGDPNSYRSTVARYSFPNIEALTLWPFYAFTLTCRVTFTFNPFVCQFEDVVCSENECKLEGEELPSPVIINDEIEEEV